MLPTYVFALFFHQIQSETSLLLHIHSELEDTEIVLLTRKVPKDQHGLKGTVKYSITMQRSLLSKFNTPNCV